MTTIYLDPFGGTEGKFHINQKCIIMKYIPALNWIIVAQHIYFIIWKILIIHHHISGILPIK